MIRCNFTAPLAAFVALQLPAASAPAAFHLWQVKEVFSNHDGTVQFIELFNSFNGEQFVSGQTLRANSGGTIKNFSIPANLSVPAGQSTAGKHMLIATPGFAALNGGVTPNFTLPDPVANGPFFDPNATTITISFLASSDSMSFSGATLPKDGINSLTDANATGFPNNPNNVSASVNSPTNFLGNAGQVNVPPPPTTTGDYNGDLIVDAADYTVWRDTLGTAVAAGSGADGNGDGTINNGDYDFWKMRFGDVIPAGSAGSTAAVLVPEPTFASLILGGILGVFLAAVRIRQSQL